MTRAEVVMFRRNKDGQKKKKESNQHKDSTPMTAYPVHQLGQRSFPVLKLDLVLFKELCNLVVVVDCHSNQAMHRLFEGG